MPTELFPTVQQARWKTELRQMVTQVDELWRYLNLPETWRTQAQEAAKCFPLRVTPEYLKQIKKNDPFDPLLRQILPLEKELEEDPYFIEDPLQEKQQSPQVGILHKYQGRVLLIFSTTCAIHCRYCFRREFPYQDHRLTPKHWAKALNYIQQDSSIQEVILSGGDPLMLDTSIIASFIKELERIPHLIRLRIHSRLPIVLPSRLDNELLACLTNTRLKFVLVIHCNHPNELSPRVRKYLKASQNAGLKIINQAVLLRGVNDQLSTLINLCENLWDINVSFYYLHLLDRVKGTKHFEVSDETAQDLMQQLMQFLPGFMIPKWVREIPGAAFKVPFILQN